MRERALLIGVLVLATGAAAGCESTQDKAAKLAASSSEAFTKKGIVVTKVNPDVKVERSWVVQDENGAAVAVRLRNTSQRRLVDVPIAVEVENAAGKSLYRNDAPGLDRSLVAIPLLRPGEEVTWVNDQVVATEKVAKAQVRVGMEKRDLPKAEPRITLQQIKFGKDPAGVTVSGFVVNKSDVEQRNLVVYAVGTKAGKVVAVGKGQVQRVKPGKRTKFNVFFIGDPTGTKLDLAVPATVAR